MGCISDRQKEYNNILVTEAVVKKYVENSENEETAVILKSVSLWTIILKYNT
jgi:hypothetical protein